MMQNRSILTPDGALLPTRIDGSVEMSASDWSRASSNFLTWLESALIFSCRNLIFARMNLKSEGDGWMGGRVESNVSWMGRDGPTAVADGRETC